MPTNATSTHLTIADLCLAIENGEIEVQQNGTYYHLKRRDIVRYACNIVLVPEKRFVLKAS